MSDTTKPSTREEIATNILAAPILVTRIGIGLTREVLSLVKRPGSKDASSATPHTAHAETGPLIFANPEFGIADRVCSVTLGGQKVCFYLYVKRQKIKAIVRKDGFAKEVIFTPEDAEKSNRVFSMDSAIAWVRKKRFEGAPPSTPVVTRPAKQKVNSASPAPTRPPETNQRRATERTQSAPRSEKKTIKEFTGRIVKIGRELRPGRDDEPAYEAYVMGLINESKSFGKEFIGEHLAELVAAMNLAVDDLIHLQFLGRNTFTIEVDGKPQERYRNEYAIRRLD